jgi:Domain of unknown function (DUF4114)
MKKILAALAATAAFAALSAPASAAVNYTTPGVANSQTYTFEVQHTGLVKLYFAGADAGNDNTLSVDINGSTVESGIFDDHSTSIGHEVTAGFFHKNEIITFTLDSNGVFYSSDPALNGGDQHIFATNYSGHAAGMNLPKSGLFLGFEDLPFGSSDLDYNDETFVATNVKIANPCGGVPEPATWTAMILGFASIGAAMRKKSSLNALAALS